MSSPSPHFPALLPMGTPELANVKQHQTRSKLLYIRVSLRPKLPKAKGRPPRRQRSQIPESIFYELATHADPLSMFRMMACNRRMRASAQRALHELIEGMTIVADPPWPSDDMMFAQIDQEELYGEDRRLELEGHNEDFDGLLAAYPKALSLLRGITIEARDDDCQAGWRQLWLLGPKLERLEVHITDRYTHAVPAGVLSIRDVWTSCDRSQTPVFAALTSLTLCATARCLEHLEYLLPYIPYVRHLTISSPPYSPSDHTHPPTLRSHPLPRLEDIYITGCGLVGTKEVGLYLWTRWLPSTPTLRRLAVCSPQVPSIPLHCTTKTSPSQLTSQLPTQLGQIIFDEVSTEDFVQALPDIRRLWIDVLCFQNIRNLVFERTKLRKASYPLLEMPVDERPSLPSLRTITWINRRLSAITVPASRSHKFEPFDRSTLLEFFCQYFSLHLAQWINSDDIFNDPFGTDIISTSVQAPVICRVTRSSSSTPRETVLDLSGPGFGSCHFSKCAAEDQGGRSQ